MIARRVPIGSFLGDDLKHVISIEGVDMTGSTATFSLARNPGDTPLLQANMTLVALLEIEPGVPTSVLQVFVAAASVDASFAPIMPFGGADLPLAWGFRMVPFPGDVGTPAITTLLYGPYILRAQIDG